MSTDPSSASRRAFLTASAAGLAGASLAPSQPAGPRPAAADTQDPVGIEGRRRILLRGGVVLSLDPRVGDFEKADVLIDGKLIADVAPSVSAGDALVVDCSGTIVMPGFITTHHHQYQTSSEASSRTASFEARGPGNLRLGGAEHLTAGRIDDPQNPNNAIWDSGAAPYDTAGCYISQLVACRSDSQGVTTGPDTSQVNHMPEQTDAMIRGLMTGPPNGLRLQRGTDQRPRHPVRVPGATGDTTKCRLHRETCSSSRDRLATLGFAGGPGPASAGAFVHRLAAWPLVRRVDYDHSVGNPMGMVSAAADSSERQRLVRRQHCRLYALARYAVALKSGPARPATQRQ